MSRFKIRQRIRSAIGDACSRAVQRALPGHQVVLYPLEDWDLAWNGDGYPEDGPHKGLIYAWALTLGPLHIRKWAHPDQEQFRAAAEESTARAHEEQLAKEEAAIERHFGMR